MRGGIYLISGYGSVCFRRLLLPYATAGLGYYRERLDAHQESAMAFNSGVGVKIKIFGPLMGRADYRVLKLRGESLYGTVHRVYSGVHLAF